MKNSNSFPTSIPMLFSVLFMAFVCLFTTSCEVLEKDAVAPGTYVLTFATSCKGEQEITISRTGEFSISTDCYEKSMFISGAVNMKTGDVTGIITLGADKVATIEGSISNNQGSGVFKSNDKAYSGNWSMHK
ncbi:MAG: hypothetical protein RLZZ292_3817 [Bacteroidota bacterium]|jgi:uncharacterized protein YaiE (UPF0345 family)